MSNCIAICAQGRNNNPPIWNELIDHYNDIFILLWIYFCIFAESRGPDPHTNTRTYRLAVCPLSHKVYSP